MLVRYGWSTIVVLGLTAGCGPTVSTSDVADSASGSSTAVTTAAEPGSEATTGSEAGGEPTDASGPPEPATSTSSGDAPAWVDDARTEYPTFRAFYDAYLERSCAAFDNVCHDNDTYPDLSDAEDYIDAFGGRCHHVTDDYDGCERVGHPVRILSGPDAGWSSEIGWLELTDTALRIAPRDRPPAGEELTIAVESEYFGRTWIELDQATAEGMLITAPADALSDLQRDVIDSFVWQGDQNRNGVFGAETPHALLTAGDPDRSLIYLGLRGEVTVLPLALTDPPPDLAELGAFGCWIEQIGIPQDDDIDAPIDYDTCTLVLP
ncbi:MAG: hypothetical protein AAGA54_27980 [Myxococcota bacterium]